MATAKRRPAPAPRIKPTVVRRSVSLDPDVDALAHALVGEAQFSALVNEALRRHVQQRQMLALLDDLDAKFGPVGEHIVKEADALWQAASRSTRGR